MQFARATATVVGFDVVYRSQRRFGARIKVVQIPLGSRKIQAAELLWLSKLRKDKLGEIGRSGTPKPCSHQLLTWRIGANGKMTWKNTHTWMNWRSDSSRRNGTTLRCRAKKSPADLLKTFVDWGLRNKRLTQKNLLAKDTRADTMGSDTNTAHEISSSFCDPDSERFFRPCNGLPFRRISGECAGFA